MLEGEQDLETGQDVYNTQNNPQNNPQNNTAIKVLYLIIGFTCVFNFIFSLSCNYGIQQFLIINSILYAGFAIYIFRKKYDIEIFTLIYLIAIVIIFVLMIIARSSSNNCNVSVKYQCPTLVPTKSPTSN